MRVCSVPFTRRRTFVSGTEGDLADCTVAAWASAGTKGADAAAPAAAPACRIFLRVGLKFSWPGGPFVEAMGGNAEQGRAPPEAHRAPPEARSFRCVDRSRRN